MNIVDYCAQKAYKLYNEQYIRDNQDKLSEIENLNYRKQADFIPQFSADLRKSVTNFLDDYTEDRDTVRKSLTQILKHDFDNLKENNIVDTSGKINTQAIAKNLNAGVKKSLPEIYEKAQNAKLHKAQKMDKMQTEPVDMAKKNVDFSKPEERKVFFANLFAEYSSLESEKEKEAFKREHFADYDKYKESIDSVLKRKEEVAKLQNENPEMTEEECEEQARKITGETKDVADVNDKLCEYSAMKRQLEKQLDKIDNRKSVEAQTINSQIISINDKIEQLIGKSYKQKDEDIQEDTSLEYILSEDIEEKRENDDLENILNANLEEENQIEEEFTIGDSLNMEELTLDEPQKEAGKETKKTNIDNIKEDKNTYINPIMAGVELSNENINEQDYIQEVKDNPLRQLINNIRERFSNNTKRLSAGQIDKIYSTTTEQQNSGLKQESYITEISENKGIFSRIRTTVSKFINRNKPLAIDTEEHNTPIVDNINQNTWELSQYGISQEEIIKNSEKIINRTKNNSEKSKTGNMIEVDEIISK